jgi:hypothetical protein
MICACNAAIAAAATLLCLLLAGLLGWAAVGPWGLLLPVAIATTGLQPSEREKRHPNYTSAVLWQTLPLTGVALVPFLAIGAAGGSIALAFAPAMAAVFALSVAIGRAREQPVQVATWIGSFMLGAFVLWVLTVGFLASVAPAPFTAWHTTVGTYGPWVCAGGVLAMASLGQLISLGDWHIHHQTNVPETQRHVALGAVLGGLTGAVLGLFNPLPSAAPIWLWVLGGSITGATAYLLDAQHNRWTRLMAWSLPKPSTDQLALWRVETAIALGDALDGAGTTPKGWELSWHWPEDRDSPALGAALRFNIHYNGDHRRGLPSSAEQVLGAAYKRFDAAHGRCVRPGEDRGVSPIQHLTAHGKIAALAQVHAKAYNPTGTATTKDQRGALWKLWIQAALRPWATRARTAASWANEASKRSR